jgi:hypothetical protein
MTNLRIFNDEYDRLGSQYDVTSFRGSAMNSIIYLYRHERFENEKKVKVLFYPMIPDFRKSIVFRKVPRLRPFVLLVRATWVDEGECGTLAK